MSEGMLEIRTIRYDDGLPDTQMYRVGTGDWVEVTNLEYSTHFSDEDRSAESARLDAVMVAHQCSSSPSRFYPREFLACLAEKGYEVCKIVLGPRTWKSVEEVPDGVRFRRVGQYFPQYRRHVVPFKHKYCKYFAGTPNVWSTLVEGEYLDSETGFEEVVGS